MSARPWAGVGVALPSIDAFGNGTPVLEVARAAEQAGGRRLGAVGGQVDFLRAATKAVIALPSRRIVEQLSGPVSTSRSDVDWVVTEHGARSLKGLSERARRRALRELSEGAVALS